MRSAGAGRPPGPLWPRPDMGGPGWWAAATPISQHLIRRVLKLETSLRPRLESGAAKHLGAVAPRRTPAAPGGYETAPPERGR